MIFELSIIGVFVVVTIIVALFAFFMWGLHYAIALAINSVIGFFALYAIKAFVWPELIISIWKIIIVAIGGIVGFAVVLMLHGLGLG